MPKYTISPEADLDLREILRYGFESFGLEQAEQFQDELNRKFQEIANFPYRNQAVDQIRGGFRRCVYRSHSIYYRIEKGGIAIIRILKRQDTKTAFSKIY